MLQLFSPVRKSILAQLVFVFLKGLKVLNCCLTAGQGCINEELCCWSEESFPVIFRSVNTGAQIRTVGADRVDTDLKIQLFFQSGSRHYASMVIDLHRPIILSCLYYDSSNSVNSILWFCILDLPEHHLLYVCDSFAFFFFFFGTDEQCRFPRPRIQREVTPDQCFYQGGFTLICKIWPFWWL